VAFSPSATSLSQTTLLLVRRCQGQQLVRAELIAARERLRVVVSAAPGREHRCVLPGGCGPISHRCVVGAPGTADGGTARCASPHGRSRLFAGDWRRHVRVGQHRQRRLLAPLGTADRSLVRLPYLCARRPRVTACPVPFFWNRERPIQLAQTFRDTRWTTMSRKKSPARRDKNIFCDHTASLDSIRGQQLAEVAPHVRRQVDTELLVFGGVSSLTPRIKDSHHDSRGRLLLSVESGGQVSRSDIVGRAGSAAAARHRSSGGSSATTVRPIVAPIMTSRGGSCPAWRTLIITIRIPSLVSFPCPFSATQNPIPKAIHAHVVQNIDRLVRGDQLLHVAVPFWMQGDMKPLGQNSKQQINVLANGLLQAVERLRLVGYRHRVGRH